MAKYWVEDHGNGFMVIRKKHNSLKWPEFQGVTPDEARAVLVEYVGKKESKRHRFACPTLYEGRSACWLSKGPCEAWEGATDYAGKPLPR